MAVGDMADDWFIRLLPLSSYVSEDRERSYSLRQLLVKPKSDLGEVYGQAGTVGEFVDGGVVLGRRSNGSKGDWGGGEFASPIISRSHAVLTVSPHGHVYVTDLRSMHGSSVRPLNESANFVLEHQSPVQLLNSDILVLGKEVLAASKYHEPLKLRIQFRYPALGKGSVADGERKSLNYSSTDSAVKKFANMSTLPHLLDIVREQRGPGRSSSGMFDDVRFSLGLPLSKQPAEQVLPQLDKFGDRPTDSKYGVPESVLYQSEGEDELRLEDHVDQLEDEDQIDDGPEVLNIHSQPHEISYPILRMRSSSAVSATEGNGPGVWYSYSSDGGEQHIIEHENTEPEAQAPDPVLPLRKIKVTQLSQLLDEMSPRSESKKENQTPSRCSQLSQGRSHISPLFRAAALPSEPRPSYTGPASLLLADAQRDVEQMEAPTEQVHCSPPPGYEDSLPPPAIVCGPEHSLGLSPITEYDVEGASDEGSDQTDDFLSHLDAFMPRASLDEDFCEEDEFEGEEEYPEEDFQEHDDFEDQEDSRVAEDIKEEDDVKDGEDVQEKEEDEDEDDDQDENVDGYTSSCAGSVASTNESGQSESDSYDSEESDGLPYTPHSFSASMEVGGTYIIEGSDWSDDNERSPRADIDGAVPHFHGHTALILNDQEANGEVHSVLSIVQQHDISVEIEATVDAPLPIAAPLTDAPLPIAESPPIELLSPADAGVSQMRDRSPSASGSDSSAGPITPPASLKRTLPIEFADEASPEAKKASIKATSHGHSTGKTIGLVLLGAAMGAVGTIAGLMQLSD